ncbi:hypothetical protein CC80DRAFT_381894, partial [Byssothecium circinans]
MTSSSLLSLPLEIFRNIFGRLELQDKACLTMTNRCFRTILDPPTHEDFLYAENYVWASSRGLYTCKGCISFRQLDHFTDDMRKGRRARRGPEANTRLCIQCGVNQGIYWEGMEIVFKGQRAILGRLCRTLTDHV